jgi:HEAT repeat protein
MSVNWLSLSVASLGFVIMGAFFGATGRGERSRKRKRPLLLLGYSYRNGLNLMEGSRGSKADETETLRSIALEKSYPVQSRAEAVFELADTGDAQVVTGLLELLNADEPEIRKAAVDGLWTLAKRRIIDSPMDRFLRVIRCDESVQVRKQAISALEICGPQAVSHLIEMLDHKEYAVRVECRRTLGRIGDQRAISPLIDRLRKGKYEERRAAVEALANMQARRAVSALIDVLRSNNPNAPIARDAARALGRIADGAAKEPIERAILEQLLTKNRPHPDFIYAYRRLAKRNRNLNP